jgi:hypothetical protein
MATTSHPGRGQAIAPTMDEPGKAIRSIVGATLVVALKRTIQPRETRYVHQHNENRYFNW